MTVLYTKDANILTIFLGGEVHETVEHRPGLFLDLDEAGKVVGVESHDAEAFLAEAQCDNGLELPERLELEAGATRPVSSVTTTPDAVAAGG